MEPRTRLQIAYYLMLTSVALNLALHLASFWWRDVAWEATLVPAASAVLALGVEAWAKGFTRVPASAAGAGRSAPPAPPFPRGVRFVIRALTLVLIAYAGLLLIQHWFGPAPDPAAQALANLRVYSAIWLAGCFLGVVRIGERLAVVPPGAAPRPGR